MVWRTQAFYWGYALESMGAELVMREGIFLFSLISMRRVLSGDPTEIVSWMNGVSFLRSTTSIPIGL